LFNYISSGYYAGLKAFYTNDKKTFSMDQAILLTIITVITLIIRVDNKIP